MPESHKIALFRIFQEALTNVARHAAAGRVTTSLRLEAGQLRLSVQDDGRGLQAGWGNKTSYGIRGMRERARQLGGSLQLHSRAGQGTRLTISLPWDSTEEASLS